MAFDPDKTGDLHKLQQAIEDSTRDLDKFRVKEAQYQRQYVGHHYPADPASHPVPYNLIDLAVTTFGTVLAANNPQVLATTHVNTLKSGARNLQIAVNHILQELEFQRGLGRAVTNAFFSMGVLKVGNEMNPRRALVGFRRETGQPFVQHVLFRNWVHDTNSDLLEDGRFMGDAREEYVDYMREAGDVFDPEIVEIMAGTDESENLHGTGPYSRHRPQFGSDQFMPRLKVRDVWLPTESVILGMPGRVDLRVDKPLYVIDWKGPEHGPYHTLGFTDVPGETMPRPPAALWFDIHNTVTLLFNQSVEQAKRSKIIYPYFGAKGARDMDLIMKAADGRTVRLGDPHSVMQPITIPGADQSNTAFIADLIQNFTYFAGNVNIVGGLSANSPTLGQDQILREQANERMATMQNRVTEVVRRVVSDLAAYLWNNPLIDLPLTKPVGTTGIGIPFRFNPDVQKGDFVDLNFELTPFSMANMTPSMKSQALVNVLNTIAPFMEPMRAQGTTLNFQKLMELLAGYNNIPELNDLAIVSGERPAQAPLSESSSPNVTRRENVRIDSPSGDNRPSFSGSPNGQGGGSAQSLATLAGAA